MTEDRKYHHGNLKRDFVDAARILLERDGVHGLSLRKCAERVGVSHTAPKNHFGNMAGLLTAVVTEGYAELAQKMRSEAEDRNQRRAHALQAYIAFAQENPALYDLMFSRDRLISDDPNLMKQIGTCFVILSDCATDLGWHGGSADAQNGKGQIALWSLVHGYAQLVTAGRFKKENMQGWSILDILPNGSAD